MSVPVTVRYFAGARAAAGRQEEQLAAGTIDELRSVLADLHGEQLAKVLTACSFLIDGVAARDHSLPLPTGGTIDVLPPFAGG